MRLSVLDKAISVDRGKAQRDEIAGHSTAHRSKSRDPTARVPAAFTGGSTEGNSKQLMTVTKKGL